MEAARNKTGQGGFSLLEVLFATAVFTFGALALMGLEIKLLEASAHARRLSEATRLAQYPIESFRSVAFSEFYDFLGGNDSASYTTTSTPSFPGNSAVQRIMQDWKDQFEDNFPKGTGTITVNRLKESGAEYGAEVKVSVTWQDNKGPHEVEMEQIFSNAFE